MPNINITIDKIQSIEFISVKADLPTPSGGIITLVAGKTYMFTAAVDLTGDRLVAGGIVTILGTSSETSSITSTGLGVGVPLLTSRYSIPIKNITLNDVDTAIYIDDNAGANAPLAVDWHGVNFLNVPNIGEIGTIDNFIFEIGAFLNSKGLSFSGTVGTIGIFNSLLRGDGLAGNIIELEATAVITRRFRVIFSSIVAFTSTVGININASATIPTEAYILDTVNFSGGGTYLSGINQTSNDALFKGCVGIANTAVNGQLYMQGNVTATTIPNTTDYHKVAGTTTASADNSKFSHADNRLTCDATVQRKYLISCSVSFTAGANNVCEFGFYDSQLAAVRTPSKTKSTANAGGRAENISFECVLNMDQGDYLEIHVKNTSAATNITVDQMNFVITEIA